MVRPSHSVVVSTFYAVHTVHLPTFHTKKTCKMHLLNYNTTDHKTHFISDAKSYMFRHQAAIIREFLTNKVS